MLIEIPVATVPYLFKGELRQQRRKCVSRGTTRVLALAEMVLSDPLFTSLENGEVHLPDEMRHIDGDRDGSPHPLPDRWVATYFIAN